MYIIATASADTYITNKIIDGSRAEDANVGRAGTLDLFKLYDETLSGSGGGHTELSKILLKFDIERIRQLTTGSLDFGAQSFRAMLKLKSIDTNLPVPRNFTVSVFPLARSFSEGDGRDVSAFSDVDVCNYISASAGNAWSISGAYATGAVGDTGVDFFSSGNLQDGFGTRNLEATQNFFDGTEDLFVDVTRVVSATLANRLQNNGFIIAFTSSQESDQVTRFVKRFASRHVINESLRPRLEVYSNSSIFDAHSNSFFDVSGSLYLKNVAGSSQRNLVSSSAELTGNNCLLIVLSTGSYSTVVTASQRAVRGTGIAGEYFGSFCISAQDPGVVSTFASSSISLANIIAASGSVVFSEKWKSLDQSVVFRSTFLTCSSPSRVSFDAVQRRLNVKATNVSSFYSVNSSHRIRVFAYDSNYEPSAVRVPRPTISSFPETYYRVRDIDGSIYIPFERSSESTRLSTDSNGMFFDMYTDGLPRGRMMTIDYLVVDQGTEYIVEDKNVKFRVE